MSNCKIIAIANQKGGTAKTTTCCNLGYALAKKGYKVCLVDFDPQANLSLSCGIPRPERSESLINDILTRVMDGKPLPDKEKFVIRDKWDKLDIIPSNINLSVTEINLRDEMAREYILSKLLEPLRSEYSYIIIDTNPYLGLLTLNALTACDEIIIPVSPQLWSATGLTDLLQTILKVKLKINPKIEIAGILLTICDERTNLFREAKELVDFYYGSKVNVFNTHIPSTVRVGEANYASRSILDYDPTSKAAIAYLNFAEEVIANAQKN